MKYIWIISLLLVCSCNTVKEDTIIDEEYEKLFPPKEIEKPENKRGEFNVELCDPTLALENYKYPGTETPEGAEEYEVTLRCVFNELDRNGAFTENVTSRYEVKYINEKKELVIIRCGKEAIQEESDGATSQIMQNGKPLKITFKVHSGYPLYLCVTGVGPRNSNVEASIEAVSTDGLIEIPKLETKQYQNEEGPNALKHPYCEYIILP
ncbi:MAG: hypothetical protein SPJ29_04655 [Phocaeicola sp.]|nr:hypothetical protein [Phocaeicola sp.]MDD7448829.1 hypothetical protein [Prevotellaceae bacterium]MDY3914481.1 hypothetical protein [Phocaeicola sp.]MDY5939026.1 hypothetical protein [Phocaeicola sp.]